MKFALVLRQRRLALSKARRPRPTKRPSHIFPFFELPLELREAIYDKSLKDRHGMLQRHGGLGYRAASTPALNLLLVSKQFKQEYRERAPKELQIFDTFAGPLTSECSLPVPLTAVSCITVSIIVFPDDVCEELRLHKRWLLELLGRLSYFVPLQLTIKAVRDSQPSRRALLEGFLEELYSRSPCATNFVAEVHGAAYHETNETGLQEDFTPMMRWSHEKGKLEDIITEEARDVEN